MLTLSEKEISRRSLLRNTLIATASLAVATPSISLAAQGCTRKLCLHNLHTGEKVSTTYIENGSYIPEALSEINYVLRDFRTNEIKPIDPKLMDILYDIQTVTDSSETFQIISGYRSPQTNAALRQQSHSVAQNSYHILGRAIDISLPGRSTSQLRDAAKFLKRGGVGYYPGQFVHVDTGDIRYW